jgi:hypothetical protein
MLVMKEESTMDDKLVMLWTNADPETAEMMVFMYAGNAIRRGWWDAVQIIVWGATARLVAENKEIQEQLLALQEDGVEVSFCISCAKKLGVYETIESLGFELIKWGVPLTEMIKSDAKIITI